MAGKPKSGTLKLGTRPEQKKSGEKTRPTLSALRRGDPNLHRGKKDPKSKPPADDWSAKPARPKRDRDESQMESGRERPARPKRDQRDGYAKSERPRDGDRPARPRREDGEARPRRLDEARPARPRRQDGEVRPRRSDDARPARPRREADADKPRWTDSDRPRRPREEGDGFSERDPARARRRPIADRGEERPSRPPRAPRPEHAPRADRPPREGHAARPERTPRQERTPSDRPRREMEPRAETCFATCPRGLEKLLADELSELGADEVETTFGGVGFKGDMSLVYRANLHSRLATRILLRVSAGKYKTEDDIYQGVLAVYWQRWFDPSRTIAVKVVAQNSPLKSLNFITLKIKDGVCDRFREETGQRPNVQTVEPDIRIRAFLTRDRFTLYLDTSGEALYKRGLRKQSGIAPINENLAAGILKLSGWQPGNALYDPMCGSGTFLMEAALMSLNRAPGLGRTFAFEKLSRFDAKAWKRIKDDAQHACKPITELPIYGSDVLGHSLRDADANLKAAGLREAVNLNKADILDIEAPAESGVMVMNPPYGVRLGDEAQLAEMYPKLGDVLKQKFANWRACIISADDNLPKLIHLKESRKTPLFNGALECRLYEYRMVEGSNRK